MTKGATSVDTDSLAADVPRRTKEKVRMVSLMAIMLDQRAGAAYLQGLATGSGMNPMR